MASCLGADHYVVAKLDRWKPFTAATRVGAASPADEFCGLIDAVVAIIGVADPPAEVTRPPADPELWDNIAGLVEGAVWDKVPAAVVTFAEDWFRRLAGNPPNPQGGKLYGRGLFATVLRPGSALSDPTSASKRAGAIWGRGSPRQSAMAIATLSMIEPTQSGSHGVS
ncbi:MAG: hypothetical protein JWN22_2580 [Nocardioides sp.]|nr:hypothetical protein [Nocardioides sp.]